MAELRLVDVDYEPLDTPTLTREIVAEEDDAETLLEWRSLLSETSEELTIMMRSLRQGGTRSHGMASKLGYLNIALSWVTRRLIEIDAVPDNAPNSVKIKRLQAHNAQLVAALEKAKKKQANTVAMLQAERSKRRRDSDASLAENAEGG